MADRGRPEPEPEDSGAEVDAIDARAQAVTLLTLRSNGGPETTDLLARTFAALESEQRCIHLRQSLPRFGAEKLRVASGVHLPKHSLNCFEHAARLEWLHHEVLRACLYRLRHQL